MDQPVLAPRWLFSERLNNPAPPDLEAQRGNVVVACAFQMLCPGCATHAVPKLKALHDLFAPLGAVVVGLHTVSEHDESMTTAALQAFLHECRVLSAPWAWMRPVHDVGPIPQAMAAYRKQGTPRTNGAN